MKPIQHAGPGSKYRLGDKQYAAKLLQDGRVDEARKLLDAYTMANPVDAEAFYLLGSCCGRLGRYQEAINLYERSLALQPNTVITLYGLGGALKAAGKLAQAADSFREVIRLDPRNPGAQLALADVLLMLNRNGESERHYQRALELDPAQGRAHYGIGVLLNAQGRIEEAVPYFRKAVRHAPGHLPAWCDLGKALMHLGEEREANACFKKALKLDRHHPDACGGAAMLQEWKGDKQKAYALIAPVLARGVENAMVGIVFARVCKQFGRCEEAVEYAERVLRREGISPRFRQHLHFALGKCLDAMGRYQEAFAHYRSGNDELDIRYEPADYSVWINRVIETFIPGLFMRVPTASEASQRPVFIVGMPRSGTTLVEQILASHPDVYGAGELVKLPQMVGSLPGITGSSLPYPGCVHDLGQESVDKLARDYLDHIHKLSPGSLRITDKLPHNFQYLGLIQILFPGARVIHCQRDPMDTGLSIYFQNFLDVHPYAKNLFNIGTHYRQYQRLMDHWKQVLSIPILDVQYEELVEEQETVMRRMVAFCGLEWSDECMQFHRLSRVANTASYDQVRRPMYNKSIGRWRAYEPFLDDLKEGLERGY